MNALLLAFAVTAADPTPPPPPPTTSPTPTPTTTTTTTTAPKADDVSAGVAFVKSIYDDYIAHQEGKKNGMPKSIDQLPISKAARALYVEGTKVKTGYPGIGFDPVIDAQDWTLSDVGVSGEKVPAESGEKVPSGVVVHATFKNFGGKHALDYFLIREDGKLVIDDIKKTTGAPLWTWREELQRAADVAKKQQQEK